MIPEARRAAASFELSDATGTVIQSGEAEALVGDEALVVGPVTASFLDVDGLSVGEYRIQMELWPGGRLSLAQLGRRFETFAQELRRVRNQARVAGMLAHGIAMPEVFQGALLSDSAARAVEIQVYDTHVTMVPADGDPWQLPLGAVVAVRAQDDPPAVVLETGTGLTILGQLGRRREACHEAIIEKREAQRRVLAELTGQSGFSDGWGMARNDVRDFDQLLERFAAPERASCGRALLAASVGVPRIGFVQLLDPDREGLQSPGPLPEHWAVFLLVPQGHLTALEILAGPAAATYVFRESPDAVNRDLQLLHFRRAPLALTAEQAMLTSSNPYRLALRRLEPLARLRSTTVARIVHSEGWANAVRSALAAPS